MSPRWRSAEERHRRLAVNALLPKATLLGVSEDELIHRGLFIERDAGGEFSLPGDIPDVLYVVGLGAVMTTVPVPADAPTRGDLKQMIVQIARPGQVVALGPLGSSHGAIRFGATAQIKSTVVGLSRDFLMDILRRQSPAARLQVAAYQNRAMSRLLYDVCRLLPASVDQRLVLRLREICRLFPAPDDVRTINPALKLSQTRTGELIAKTRGTANRASRRARAAGILRPTGLGISFAKSPEPPSSQPSGPAVAGPKPSPLEDEVLRRRFSEALAQARARTRLPAATISVLQRRAELHRHARGERIPIADDQFATLLVSGVARVDCAVDRQRRTSVWMARPGDFVGAGWTGATRPAPLFNAIAHEPCVVARLRPEVMMEVLATFDGRELLHFFGYCQAALSRQLYDKCRLLCLQSTDALLYQLRVLAERFPEAHARGTIIRLDLTDCREVAPRMLGDFIGVLPTSAAKAFAELRRQGLVEFIAGRILLPGFRLERRVRCETA